MKLGPGGIREIEFIVQAFQLLRGGSDRRLQTQSLLSVLPLLEGEKLLRRVRGDGARARRTVFLRRLENRLQMIADEQTHDVPDGRPGARAPRARHGRTSDGTTSSASSPLHRAHRERATFTPCVRARAMRAVRRRRPSTSSRCGMRSGAGLRCAKPCERHRDRRGRCGCAACSRSGCESACACSGSRTSAASDCRR